MVYKAKPCKKPTKPWKKHSVTPHSNTDRLSHLSISWRILCSNCKTCGQPSPVDAACITSVKILEHMSLCCWGFAGWNETCLLKCLKQNRTIWKQCFQKLFSMPWDAPWQNNHQNGLHCFAGPSIMNPLLFLRRTSSSHPPSVTKFWVNVPWKKLH